jgi:serine/threonine protein kinase
MTDLVGQQLGNYRLVRLLGRGGFAEVFLAEHVLLKRPAAVKVLLTYMANEEFENFRSEAQTISDLEHPHIVPVRDFGIQNNIPFLVMKYAANGTLLQQHPTGQTLPLPMLVDYVEQIAEALQYAHNKKIIHRDVKPENMLLDERNSVLLSDFGIATFAHSTNSWEEQRQIGTVVYMAPEQIQSKAQTASDQYSLAVVIYQWLCGAPPFEGSAVQLMYQHMNVLPPSLCEKNPAIPPEVEQVVLKALAKDPKQRFEHVAAFAQALKRASTAGAMPMTSSRPGAPEAQTDSILLYTYRKHSDWIYALAWSPDSTSIASGGRDKVIHVWEAGSGKTVAEYKGHSKRVSCIAWAASGGLIASAGKDNTVHIWQASSPTNSAVNIYRGHTNSVNAIAWSPNNQMIASGSSGKNIHIWHALTGKQMRVLRGHGDEVNAVAWSPDGALVVSGSSDKSVRVWQAATGQLVLTYRGHKKAVTALLWSADGRYIASASEDTTVQIWEAAMGTVVRTYNDHAHAILAIATLPGDSRIASASYKTVHVWNATTGNTMFKFEQHSDWVRASAWAPNGKTIASAGDDKTVQVWSIG